MIQSQVQPRRWPDPETADDVRQAESAYSTAQRIVQGDTGTPVDERRERAVRALVKLHDLSLEAAKDLVNIVTQGE